MKKEDIREVVAQLKDIVEEIMTSQDDCDLNNVMNHLQELVCELGCTVYNGMAYELYLATKKFRNGTAVKQDVANKAQELIDKMKEDLGPDTVEELSAICGEVKDVCGGIAKAIGRGMRTAVSDISDAVKQDKPKCSEAVEYMRGAPKRMEKKLKGVLRNWLMSDDETDNGK